MMHKRLTSGKAWGLGALLLAGVLLILYTTLNPFTFSFRPLSLAAYLASFEIPPSNSLDFPRNILLFMPLGFALAGLLLHAGVGRRKTAVFTLFAGFLLTWLVESLQIFLPGRTPSLSDLLSNTLGAWAGYGCRQLWLARILLWRRIKTAVTPPRLLAAFAVYAALILLSAALLRNATRLDPWDTSYPLMLGNEASGDRPWAGVVEDLLIFDAALPATEALPTHPALAAHYALHGADGLVDRVGRGPDLAWRGTAAAAAEGAGLALGADGWLRTAAPPRELSARLSSASRFTIALTVAPADLAQAGPARIVSLSLDPVTANLQLGQEGERLVVRVRTRMSNAAGMTPELQFPGIFGDAQPQRLVVSYDGVTARVSVDGRLRAQAPLQPALTFFRYVLLEGFWRLSATHAGLFVGGYYLLVFAPLGGLLGTAVGLARRQGRRRAPLLLLGLLALLALAVLLDLLAAGAIRPAFVLLGLAIGLAAQGLAYRLA